MSLPGYDDAVFIQKCKRKAVNNTLTPEQVVEVLCDCMPDILEHIPEEQHPHVREHIRKDYVQAFKWQLDAAGLILSEV